MNNHASFLDIFDCEYLPKIGIRALTFRQIFEFLINKNKDNYTIVETGCAREDNNWLGDGQSTLMFDRFVNYYDGQIYTVDLSSEACNYLSKKVSKKTNINCGDSVSFLKQLSNNKYLDIDLLYLDSYDLDWNNSHPSALHHLKELTAIMPILQKGTLIVVNDSFRNVATIPTIDSNGKVVQTVIRDLGISGKGKYLAEFFQNIGCQIVIEGYQIGWIFDEKSQLVTNFQKEINPQTYSQKITIQVTIPLNNDTQKLNLSLNPNEMTQKMMLDYFKNGKLYEPEISGLLLQILQKGDCFIDIGAHIGYYSMLASILVGETGFVYAVEPALSNQEHIQENIKLNNFNNLKLIPFALGAETKETELFINLDNDGGHALFDVGLHPYNKQSREHQTKQNIHLTTLDEALKDEQISNLKLIKIDVEGAEYQALQGAVKTLNTYKVPYIICEINRFCLDKMGTNEQQLRAFMASLGYETYLLLPNEPEKAPVKLAPNQYFQSDYVFNVLFTNQILG